MLTDFGAESVYVAEVRAVLVGLAPESQMIDLSHSITPYNVREAEYFLRRSAHLYPRGTVHLVVVDPGVGSTRRGIAVCSQGHYFVGPDNGVMGNFTETKGAKVVELNRPDFFRQPVSPTFHGRDIFAPVAARLATGMLLESLGTVIDDPIILKSPSPEVEGGAIKGQVVEVDRFGNLITNIPVVLAPESSTVCVGTQKATWVKSYSEGKAGTLLVLESSDGYVELALREGSAAELLGYPDVGEVLINK